MPLLSRMADEKKILNLGMAKNPTKKQENVKNFVLQHLQQIVYLSWGNKCSIVILTWFLVGDMNKIQHACIH